jgi:hypothetical protein
MQLACTPLFPPYCDKCFSVLGRRRGGAGGIRVFRAIQVLRGSTWRVSGPSAPRRGASGAVAGATCAADAQVERGFGRGRQGGERAEGRVRGGGMSEGGALGCLWVRAAVQRVV